MTLSCPTGFAFDLNGFRILTQKGSEPSVAFDGETYFMAKTGYYGAFVSPSGLLIKEFPISTQFGLQSFQIS